MNPNIDTKFSCQEFGEKDSIFVKKKAIQKELGRGEKSEFDELKKKIESAGMPKDVKDKLALEVTPFSPYLVRLNTAAKSTEPVPDSGKNR